MIDHKKFISEEKYYQENGDPCMRMCHSIIKLKAVATAIKDSNTSTIDPPFNGWSCEAVRGLGEILEETAEDLEYLSDTGQHAYHKQFHKIRELKAKLAEIGPQGKVITERIA